MVVTANPELRYVWVWYVESGSYSNYSMTIQGVFDTRDEAKAAHNALQAEVKRKYPKDSYFDTHPDKYPPYAWSDDEDCSVWAAAWSDYSVTIERFAVGGYSVDV